VSYATGTLQFSKFDVTECQWTAICTFCFTGLMRPKIWNFELFGMITLRHLYFGGAYFAGLVTFMRNLKDIFYVGFDQNSSSVANTSVMSPGTNMIVITFLCTMVGFKTDIYYRYPVVFILYYGILTAKITNKLIVATMTKSELRLTDPSLWSLVVLLLNQYYSCFIDEDYLFPAAFAYSCFDLLRFLYRTYKQIGNALGIEILTVNKLKSQ